MGDDYEDSYGYDDGDFGSDRDDFGFDRDDYSDGYGGYGSYGGSFSERYDRANGAPFGTFDIDGDGELDFLERATKFDHYQSLWDEEDRLSSAGDDLTLDGFDKIDGFDDDLEDDLDERDDFGESYKSVSLDLRKNGNENSIGNGSGNCTNQRVRGSEEHDSHESSSYSSSNDLGYKSIFDEEESIYSKAASTLLYVGAMPAVEKEMFEKLESESYDAVRDGLCTLRINYTPEYFKKTEAKYVEKLPRLKEKQYNEGLELMRNKEYFQATKVLGSICNYKEAQKCIDKCNEELENIKKEKRAKMFTRLLIASGIIIGVGFLTFFILAFL